jgi:hypothetical protein
MLLQADMKIVKKFAVLQVNDAADRLRLVVFLSKVRVQRFYIQITEHTGWGRGVRGERGERRGVPPPLCWLTVIWSGAPTDSLAGGGGGGGTQWIIFCLVLR